MIIINMKDKIEFNWLNIINFRLIRFAFIKTEETFEEKYIS